MKRLSIFLLLALVALPMMAQNDVILTTDSHKFEVKIIAMTPDTVSYNMAGAPITLSLPMSQVADIVFRTGDTVHYNAVKVAKPAENAISEAAVEYAADVAGVAKFHGLYVFTECTPIAPYEVIGTVSYSGSNGAVGFDVGGGVVVASEISAQYPSIRAGLVRAALAASNDVQGIIIEPDQEGSGIARMIRFKTPENNELARVKKKGDFYIYVDSKPTLSYTSLGHVEIMFAKTSIYTDILNKLIRKAVSQHTQANALLITFVEGGLDNARMIEIKEKK